MLNREPSGPGQGDRHLGEVSDLPACGVEPQGLQRHAKGLSFNALRGTGQQSSFGGFCELKPLMHSHWMWASCGALALVGAFGHCAPCESSLHCSVHHWESPVHCAGTLQLGRTWRGLGCSSVLPQIKMPQMKIRCRQLGLLVNVKPAGAEINCNGTVRYKRFSAAREALVYNNDEWIHKCPPQYEEYFLTQSCLKYLCLQVGVTGGRIRAIFFKFFHWEEVKVFFSGNLILLEIFKILKCIQVVKLHLF